MVAGNFPHINPPFLLSPLSFLNFRRLVEVAQLVVNILSWTVTLMHLQDLVVMIEIIFASIRFCRCYYSTTSLPGKTKDVFLSVLVQSFIKEDIVI